MLKTHQRLQQNKEEAMRMFVAIAALFLVSSPQGKDPDRPTDPRLMCPPTGEDPLPTMDPTARRRDRLPRVEVWFLEHLFECPPKVDPDRAAYVCRSRTV